MMIPRKYLLYSLFLIASFGCNKQSGDNIEVFRPSDKNATEEAVAFYSKLKSGMDKGIMLGHQDALAYGNAWYGEEGRSDVKSACGDYPAVFEWNLGKVETGALLNVDSVMFSQIRSYIREVDQLGGVSTLSWYADNPLTGGRYNDCSDDRVVSFVLTQKETKDKYLSYLDHLADFFDTLKDKEGKHIPVILRLFNDGDISDNYWWNTRQASDDEFKKLWKMTVDYLRNEKNIHHVLYAYSVRDKELHVSTDYYPGNEYVDIIGTDIFLDMKNDTMGNTYKRDLDISLSSITDFADKHNKIPAVTSTGLEGVKISTYFTQLVYPVISKYKLSYILFGRNAWNIENHYFIPVPGHPAGEDFIGFVNSPNILTCSDLN
jgi:hypothetical protein